MFGALGCDKGEVRADSNVVVMLHMILIYCCFMIFELV